MWMFYHLSHSYSADNRCLCCILCRCTFPRLPGALIHFEPESPTLAMHVLKVETYNVTLYKDTNRNRLKSKDNINELKFETFVNFVPIVLKRNQENIHS